MAKKFIIKTLENIKANKNFVPNTPIAALGASVKKALKICGRTRNPADIVVFLSSVRETQEGCKLFSEELENIIGNKLNNNYLSQYACRF